MTLFETLDVDAVIVVGGTNRRYLSGWSADDHTPDRPSGVMLVTPDARYLYASPTNLPWASAEVNGGVETRALNGAWPDSIARHAKELGLKRIGFEDSVTPVAAYWALASALGEGTALVPVGTAIDDLRRVKSEAELESICKALAATDEAFIRAASHLRAGMTERELAAFIDQQFRELGAEGNAFDTIVASGPNAAKPHHSPGDRKIGEGEPVIIDMGARVDGYCGDLTRTVWAGQPTDRLGTMYHLVADAQRAAFAAVTGGVEARAVDRAARDVFAAKGMAEYFVHSVGHSLGLQIHESPFLNQSVSDPLVPGNVVTIEPGLYIPDWGGVRIEDVVLVRDNGYENLTKAPKLLGES